MGSDILQSVGGLEVPGSVGYRCGTDDPVGSGCTGTIAGSLGEQRQSRLAVQLGDEVRTAEASDGMDDHFIKIQPHPCV